MIAALPFINSQPAWSRLLAFYKLDGLTDSSGNGNTLTNDNGVSFVAGKIGNAAQFDGTNWLESSSLDLSGLSEFTICFWVQHLDSSEEELNELAGDWSSGVGPIVVAFGGLGQFAAYGFSSLGVRINTSLGEFTVLDATSRNAGWRFIAIRLSESGLQLKTNNENWITTAVSSGATLGTTQGTFYVGDGGDAVPLADEDKLDAFGIWRRSLSDSNIVGLYNAGAGREI